MRAKTAWIVASVVLLALPCFAQETPKSLVTTYEGLADIMPAARQAEANLVRSILEGHFHSAATAMKQQDYEAAAAAEPTRKLRLSSPIRPRPPRDGGSKLPSRWQPRRRLA